MPLDLAGLEREFPKFAFIVERGKSRECALTLGPKDPFGMDVGATRAGGYPDLLEPEVARAASSSEPGG